MLQVGHCRGQPPGLLNEPCFGFGANNAPLQISSISTPVRDSSTGMRTKTTVAVACILIGVSKGFVSQLPCPGVCVWRRPSLIQKPTTGALRRRLVGEERCESRRNERLGQQATPRDDLNYYEELGVKRTAKGTALSSIAPLSFLPGLPLPQDSVQGEEANSRRSAHVSRGDQERLQTDCKAHPSGRQLFSC